MYKKCKDCGKTIEVKTSKVRCTPCQKKSDSRRQMEWRAKKDPRIKLGVGSGGNQWGADNHMYKGGNEHSYRKIYRDANPKRYCRVCKSKKHLCIHHIDADRTNDSLDNLIELCRSCHAKVHELVDNINN